MKRLFWERYFLGSFLVTIGLFLAERLPAQAKPDFFPEDVTHEGVEVRCFCQPGVRNKSRTKGLDISYSWIGGGTFAEEDGMLTAPLTTYRRWRHLEIDLKVPVYSKEHLKILVGYKFAYERFTIDRLGVDYPATFMALDQTPLKSNSLSAMVVKPVDEKKYLAFRLRYTSAGNYTGGFHLGGRYAIYKGVALFGIKPHDDFEWGLGLNVSKSFRRTTVLPFLLYNRTIGARWGVEAVFPGYMYGRFNFSPTTILLFGAEYNSESYRLEIGLPTGGLDYALNHSEILGMLRLEQQIAPWVWGNLKLGYQLNFSTDFESKAPDTAPFNVEPSNALFFQMGFFLSPPDHLRKKR